MSVFRHSVASAVILGIVCSIVPISSAHASSPVRASLRGEALAAPLTLSRHAVPEGLSRARYRLRHLLASPATLAFAAGWSVYALRHDLSLAFATTLSFWLAQAVRVPSILQPAWMSRPDSLDRFTPASPIGESELPLSTPESHWTIALQTPLYVGLRTTSLRTIAVEGLNANALPYHESDYVRFQQLYQRATGTRAPHSDRPQLWFPVWLSPEEARSHAEAPDAAMAWMLETAPVLLAAFAESSEEHQWVRALLPKLRQGQDHARPVIFCFTLASVHPEDRPLRMRDRSRFARSYRAQVASGAASPNDDPAFLLRGLSVFRVPLEDLRVVMGVHSGPNGQMVMTEPLKALRVGPKPLLSVEPVSLLLLGSFIPGALPWILGALVLAMALKHWPTRHIAAYLAAA